MASALPALPRTPTRPAGPRPRPGSPSQPAMAIVPSNAPYIEFGSSPSIVGLPNISRGTLSRGTVLHKGFYDLLSILPNTASQLRAWTDTRNNNDDEMNMAGPRYDQIPPPSSETKPLPTPVRQTGPPRGLIDKMSAILPPLEPQTTRLAASISAYFASPPSPTSPIKPRRVSKDMISSPTGFM